MGKYLEIADRALRDMAETQKTGSKPAKPSARYGEKSERSERSPDDKLRLLVGDDWPEISADPDQLAALKATAEIAEQIQRGIVPEHYTASTICDRCGPVPYFPGMPPTMGSCLWCFARVRGVKVPTV